MPEFQQLLVEQIPRLRRYARALTGDPHAADDLVQDCLERAWCRADQWQRGSNLRAWLLTVMHHLFIDGVRLRRRRIETVPIDDQPSLPVTRPEHEGALSIRDLQKGLESLSDDQREVLLLVSLEGLRYEEAAAVLDLPVGTVMSRLFRARERMRQVLNEGGEPRLRRVK